LDTLVLGDDLRVCRLGFGTMSLTGRGVWGEPRNREAARGLLRHALDLGVTFVDTADSYGPEVAEHLIAEALRPYPEGLVIATKGGFRRRGPDDWYADGRAEHLRAACERSLRRLRLERIDLYQLHTVDPRVPLEESLAALVELRDEGKIRHLGVCNVDRSELLRARACAPIVSVQNRYSLADRAHEPVLEECEGAGLAFIAWAPLAKSFLTRRAGQLGAVSATTGVTPAQAALAWLLNRSPALLPIPGTASLDHLEENMGVLEAELDLADLEVLDGYRSLELEARRLARRVRVHAGLLRRRLRLR
jgi:aryl-alcohol dehydrogenase-like predicted oxidoreductase